MIFNSANLALLKRGGTGVGVVSLGLHIKMVFRGKYLDNLTFLTHSVICLLLCMMR